MKQILLLIATMILSFQLEASSEIMSRDSQEFKPEASAAMREYLDETGEALKYYVVSSSVCISFTCCATFLLGSDPCLSACFGFPFSQLIKNSKDRNSHSSNKMQAWADIEGACQKGIVLGTGTTGAFALVGGCAWQPALFFGVLAGGVSGSCTQGKNEERYLNRFRVHPQ